MLIDPHLKNGDGSKAAVTMPRSFEMLERVGVGTAIADVGRPAGLARLGSNGGWLGKITGFTSARLSQYVPTAVGQNIVEAHLCARYLELGGKILRAARVMGVSEDDTAADEGGRCTVAVERYVYVRPPAQAPPLPPALAALTSTSLSARFAVGADGKQSMVRESLGLGYEGHEYAQSFFLADVELEEGVAEATGWERGLHAVIEADGAFLLFIRLQARLLRKRARPRPRFTVPLVDRGTCFGPTTARPAWNRSSARRSPSRNSEGRPKGRCGCTRGGHVRRSFSRSGGPQRCPEASHSRSRASRRRPPSLSRAGWSRTTPRRCRRRREQRLFTPTAVNRSHTTPRRTERSSSLETRRTATRRPAGRA